MSLLGGRLFGSVSGNTSLNSSTSSFSFLWTSGLTLDKICSSRSSTLRNRFFGPSFFIRSRIFPSVSQIDSDFTTTLTFLFSYPRTSAKNIGVFFFTSLFNYLTDMICLSQDSLDDPSVFIFFSVLVLLPLNLSFRVSFLLFSLSFSPVRSFSPFVSFFPLF